MQRENPKLSIVVPVFNGFAHIQDTLSSLEEIERVLSCEILFQNSLSTDGTTKILEDFCRRGPHRYHYNEADLGQSDAINKGIAKTRGTWVTWLCADDMLLPVLSLALSEAEEADADIVYGDIIFLENGSCFPAIGTEQHAPGALSRKRLIIQQPGTCILRNAWLEAGGVRNELNWSMDYDLFLRLESAGRKFLRSHRFLAVIRVHKEAKTSSSSVRRVLEIWSIIFQSHRRRPGFFRVRPYIVYGIEYVIKALHARGTSTGSNPLLTQLLRLLHRLFWLIARPKEKKSIEQRFQSLPPEICQRILKVKGDRIHS